MKHRRQIRPTFSQQLDSLKAAPPSPAPKQINTPVTLSFEHVQPGAKHCLSLCLKDELKDISDCLRQLTTLTWQMILEQGGKGPGHKKGLAYTNYPDRVLRTVTRPTRLSPEVGIGAVRASRGSRVFGAYKDHVFYVLWFDRTHEIVPDP